MTTASARDPAEGWRLAAVVVVQLLLVLASALPFPDCTSGPLSHLAVCDASQSVTIRAASMVAAMNLSEKASRLQNGSPAVARLGLPAYQWWSEALHGIMGGHGVSFATEGPYRCATSFPEPLGLAASFDRPLWSLVGSITANEGRVFSNAGRAGLDFWTPNINIFRDPRWGRGQETSGEDTYLSSEYAYYVVRGYQEGEDPRYFKVVANCKHYAGYDVEHWHGMDRCSYNALISDQDLVETYLPSFKSCLKDAHVGSIMCAYNAVNGVPSCANGFLNNEVARERWGWDGWVTSDCGAIMGLVGCHHYVQNNSAQVQVALRGGCDIGCDTMLADYGVQAVKDGLVSEADIDRSLMRQFTSLIRLGYFDDPKQQPYRQYGEEHLHTDEYNAVSMRAARESLVLLKNDGQLPLSTTHYQSVAVIGPAHDAPSIQKGNYAGNACFVRTPLLSFQNLTKLKVTAALGCDINSTSTAGFATAVAAAQASDLIVYVGGLDHTVETEGHDRNTIDLPGQQLPLIRRLAQVGKPMIVVLYGGGSVDIRELRDSNSINAIIYHAYPSQSGGDALVEAIFGAWSPAGRLVATWYPASYVDQVELTDQSMRPSDHNPGRTYKFYPGEVVFPFGHGLSYSNFSYQTVSALPSHDIADLISSARVDDAVKDVAWTVNVTNTGKVVSDVVVLAFVSSATTIAGVTAPIKELFDFAHLHAMHPGQSEILVLGLSYRVLAHIDEAGHAWLIPGEYDLFINNEAETAARIALQGAAQLIEAHPGAAHEPRPPKVIHQRSGSDLLRQRHTQQPAHDA